MPRQPKASILRILERLEVSPTGCWEVIGAVDPDGYAHITDSNGKNWPLHRLMFFLTNVLQPQFSVLHKCDNPRCCNPAHLYQGTQLQNRRDCVARNRQAKGESNGNSQLTEAEVRAILAQPKMNQRALAKKFGISQATLWAILHRKIWRHIDAG